MKKLQLIVIIVSVIVIVLGGASYFGKGEELKTLKNEKESIKVPPKETMTEELTQDEVKKYEKLVNSKIDDFQQHDLDEGEFNTNNSGVSTIRYLMSPPGGRIIQEKDSVNKFVKHYSDFDVKISDVTAKPDGSNGADVYFKVQVKQKGNKVNPQYSLAQLQFNESDELIGGALYEEQ